MSNTIHKVKLISGITLVHAALFVPPLILGLTSAYRGYLLIQHTYGVVHLGALLPLAAHLLALAGIAIQIPISVIPLFTGRNPFAAFQGAVVASTFGSLVGLAVIVLGLGVDTLLLPGTIGLLIVVVIAGVWPCVAKFLWPNPRNHTATQEAGVIQPEVSRSTDNKIAILYIVGALLAISISATAMIWLSGSESQQESVEITPRDGSSIDTDANVSSSIQPIRKWVPER